MSNLNEAVEKHIEATDAYISTLKEGIERLKADIANRDLVIKATFEIAEATNGILQVYSPGDAVRVGANLDLLKNKLIECKIL